LEWQGDPDATTYDIVFTSELLSQLNQTYNISQTEIFATGKSNGGGFLSLLACDQVMSSKIAAFAAASGAFYVNNSQAANHP
jgi:poly(3-hydroxybutyrate) depolymerase